MAVLDDFEEVFSFGIAKRGQKQIVEDEDLDLRQFPPMSVSMPVRNMSLPHFRHVKSGGFFSRIKYHAWPQVFSSSISLEEAKHEGARRETQRARGKAQRTKGTRQRAMNREGAETQDTLLSTQH